MHYMILEQQPLTQVEQDALFQWAHEQFCHGILDPGVLPIFAFVDDLRTAWYAILRMIVFGDFIIQNRAWVPDSNFLGEAKR